MEISKTNRLRVKRIEVRRLKDRIAVATQVAVALIVSHHDYDVLFF